MKQKYLLFALILLSISACTTVQFETSQPKDAPILSEFPNELIGKYVSLGKVKDTLIIMRNAYKFKETKIIGIGKVSELNQNVIILKKSNDYFVLSEKDSNAWEVIALKQKGQKISFYLLAYDKDSRVKTINRIKEITNVVEISDTDSNGKYRINPTKEEFQLLLDKKIFSKIMEYKKIK